MSIFDDPVDGAAIPAVQDKAPSRPKSRLEELMREYKTAQGLIDSLKEKTEVIRDEILDFFPNEPGEYDHLTEDNSHVLEVRIAEKWTWDEDKLAEKVGENDLPYFIKRKLTIDKRKFERLDQFDKELYLDALTRSPGAVRISVKEIPPQEDN